MAQDVPKRRFLSLFFNSMEKHEILYEFQFGFRKGHSTSQAIAEIADNLRNAIDDNLYSFGVFLDFPKAFDTVNHTILLKKWNGTGYGVFPSSYLQAILQIDSNMYRWEAQFHQSKQ